ncbi:hypothetical protein T484DRAFT_1907657 [Baffinella frigidus]|nr:hypothetical protein T484DRAFT_1907657 [Cryptophyta sp. CCMP2293]
MCTKNKCVESMAKKTAVELLRVKRQLERLNAMQKLSKDSSWTPHGHGDASSSLTQTSASSAELFTAFRATRGRNSSTTTRKEIVDQDKNMLKKLISSKGKDGGSPLSLAAWSARTGVSSTAPKGKVNEVKLAATSRMANHKIKFADAIKARDVNRMQTELLALFKQNVDQGFVRIVQPAPHEERHCESTAAQHRWAKGSDDGGGCETFTKKLRSESTSVQG